jgi:hypothetical protein
VVHNTVSDVTGGLGVLIDGNPANMTMSIGHVVRGNSGAWAQGTTNPVLQFRRCHHCGCGRRLADMRVQDSCGEGFKE